MSQFTKYDTVLTSSIPILGITLLTETQRGDDRVSIVASKREEMYQGTFEKMQFTISKSRAIASSVVAFT